ncbi:lysoplasmalogenase family protein [Tenacibaculum halocynthiae]|uniref:lysoplasmalogenase family protein n=1 Tax=Tenacibaculum halocynthiae TaxID=1254437 RepID=UPI003D65FBEA
MKSITNKYSILYFIASLLSLFFIDNDAMIELVLKLLSLIFLSFLYLSTSKEINYWYVLVLLCSIASDASLIFDSDLLMVGTGLLIANRILYIIISRRALFRTNLKTLAFYFVVCLLVFVVIYVVLKPYLQEISYIFISLGITSAIMILFAFLNYLNKMNTQNKLFLFGLFLIITGDILMAFNKFLDYNMAYVLIYTIIYYIARYLICESMIVNKLKK